MELCFTAFNFAHDHFIKCNCLGKWAALKLAHLFGFGTIPGIYHSLDYLGESSITSLILQRWYLQETSCKIIVKMDGK